MIEDRIPVNAAVGALENSARSGADIIDIGVAGYAGSGDDPVSDGSDVAIAELPEEIRVHLPENGWQHGE